MYVILWYHPVHKVRYFVVSSGPQNTLYCGIIRSTKYVILWCHPVHKVRYAVVSSGPQST